MRILRRETLVASLWVSTLLIAGVAPAFAQQPTEADRQKYAQAAALFREADAVPDDAPIEKRRAAIEKYLTAARIFREIGSPDDEANSMNAAANIHDELGEKPEALRLYLKVADILHEIGDRPNLALTLNAIGDSYQDVGLNAKALEYFNVSLAFFRALKNQQGEANTLGMMGNAYSALGEKQKALDAMNQSIEIRKRIGDKSGEMTSLGNIAVVYISLGENEKALNNLDRALKMARATGDRESEASALHNIASVYEALGDARRALELYEQSLTLVRSLGRKDLEGTTLNNVGAMYLVRGEIEKAREYLYRAMPLRLQGDDVNGAIETLVNIGFLHSELGEKEKALRFYEQALPIMRRTGDKSGEAETLHNIGFLFEKAGDRLKAIDYYNQALPLRRLVGDRTGEARTLANLMFDWDALGNGRLAALYGKQAINRFEELRSAIRGLDRKVRERYLRTIEDTYRDLADILIEQGRLAEAEQVLGMLKEEEVFAFQRRDDKVARELLQTSSLSESERAAIANYEKLADRITAIALEHADLDRERLGHPEGEFPKQARLDELDRLRSDAITTFQKYLEQLKVEFAKSAKANEVAMVDSSLQETLRELNAQRTVVVSTIVGERRLNIIVTTVGVQRAHTVDITEKELNKLIGAFRVALTSPGSGKPVDPRPAGQKLYDILVKPIEGDLAGMGADTILWSLDGALRYLPMAAIWDPQKGYLAERFANGVVTLASRDRLLAKPVEGNRTALGAGVSAPVDGFSPLEAVPDELDCIVTDPVARTVSAKPVCETGVINGQKLLDQKFDERGFRAAVGRYSILHLASHFKFVPGNENDSYLLLGGGADRRFTVSKLNGLSLSGVELLALSACNTATPGGAKENGVEIEGFGAVAQKRGARSVLATLWPVADPSTRDFMVEFYRRFGTGGMGKAESIRQAQLKLIRGSYAVTETLKPPRADAFTTGEQAVGPPFPVDKKAPYAHPYYWAPFILFGNWR